jgi:rod shape-determining protein MreD
MNLYRKSLTFSFVICVLSLLFIPAIFPNLQLIFFAPFLVILYYQKNFRTCLWGSLFCGIIVDLLSSEPRLGLYTINYVLVTIMIYSQRYNFFSDSLSTLPLLTFIFAFVSTILEIVILVLFDYPLSLQGTWMMQMLVYKPMLNAWYALFFLLPDAVAIRLKRMKRT